MKGLGLRGRVLVAVLVSPVLAALVVTGAIELARDRLLTPAWTISPEELDRCEAEPASWNPHVGDVVAMWAYDLDGVSAHPDAPPLDPALLEGVRAQGYAFAGSGRARGDARQVRDAGPCAILRLRFDAAPDFAMAFRVGLIGGGAVAMLLVVMLALLLVVQPLVGRIERLSQAALAVGGRGYRPARDPTGDALGGIAHVLDRSHERILADQARLEQRQRDLEQHLADTAHDLRTPLASLLLAVQELKADSPSGAPALGRALDDAEYVIALVDNLHQASRLRAGIAATDGSCDLASIVERLGARFRALGLNREVEVGTATPDAPVVVRGGPALAERAIANLIHNAVRHGHSGGHVAVMLDEQDGTFTLTVLDDGPGLPEDAVDLMAPTFLLDPARQRSRGLGLAITAAAAEQLGWTLSLEPAEPTGLKAVITGACGLPEPG